MPQCSEQTAMNIAHVCDIRFHRSFILPPNTTHGRPRPIRVSYADLDHGAGRSNPDQIDTSPTLLFVPGGGATRYGVFNAMNSAAERFGVRLIVADNFGIGGTDHIPLQYRVISWIDLISELLNHLQIKHIALASHSVGTIYLFNALLQLRHLLHPINPLVFIFAPWVAPNRSQLPWFAATRYVPKAILRKLYWYRKWILPLRYLRPACKPCKKGKFDSPLDDELQTTVQEGQMDDLSDHVQHTSIAFENEPMTAVTTHRLDHALMEEPPNSCHNAPHAITPRALAMKYRQQERFAGIGDDILLSLKRGPGARWGCFSDFDEAAQQLQEQEKAYRIENQDRANPLRVETIFAENDSFIDYKGATWFESLWPDDIGWVQYNSLTVLGARHTEVVAGPFLAWMMQEVSNSQRGGIPNRE